MVSELGVGLLLTRQINKQKRFFRDFGAMMTVGHLGGTLAPGLLSDYWYKSCIKKISYEFHDILSCPTESRVELMGDGCPIWVMWWQGVDGSTPPLIKCCLDSIKRHAGKHDIKIVTEKNYSEYVLLPNYIIDKFKKGYISIQCLSDIIRFALLKEYGGIWLDATIYLNNDFDTLMYNYSYYSAKNLSWQPDLPIWSNKWAGFFTAGSAQMPLFEIMYNCFDSYWCEHNALLDYFLIDIFMWAIYYSNDNVREIIDRVPENNLNLYRLEKSFDGSADAFVTDKDEIFYKLSSKSEHKMFLKSGEPTLYNKIVSPYM